MYSVNRFRKKSRKRKGKERKGNSWIDNQTVKMVAVCRLWYDEKWKASSSIRQQEMGRSVER